MEFIAAADRTFTSRLLRVPLLVLALLGAAIMALAGVIAMIIEALT